jgi:D-amino-acid oxidase
MKINRKIQVIGAGVIGLCTAIRLQEAGCQVVLISKDEPLATTSAKAGAIWMPYLAQPLNKVLQWSQITYHELRANSLFKETGVYEVNFLVLQNAPEKQDWMEIISPDLLKERHFDRLPLQYNYAWEVRVPFVEPPSYLPYLLDRFLKNGGRFEQKTISSFDEVRDQSELIVNCTGLGAKTLVEDPELYPVRGHLARLSPIKSSTFILDDEGPNQLAYVFTRQHDTILGGTSEAYISDIEPDPEEIQALLRRCKNIFPPLPEDVPMTYQTGLRPARSTIRLEWDSVHQVLHNYGHGGSGYTTCWGCAEEAVQILGRQVDR